MMVKTKEFSPASGYYVKITIEGCNAEKVKSLVAMVVKALEIFTRNWPENAETVKEKKPCGCSGS